MLEIRRGTANRTYENIFFREFSKNLAGMFEKYDVDGLLIGNSECEVESSLQIDALLIVKNSICIIDFKKYAGEVVLPREDNFKFGLWITKDKVTKENITIRGGSFINPYLQLNFQKDRFIKVYDKHIKETIYSEDTVNPFHVAKIVCFHKPIELVGNIPGKDELVFFITDSDKYSGLIKDIIDVDVTEEGINLSAKSYDAFKNIFKANPFDPEEDYKKTGSGFDKTSDLNYKDLDQDQLDALNEIKEFVTSDSEQAFILQGTSLSGKSHLIPFITEIAFDKNITQVELFALSARVANNLLSDSYLNFNSIYANIYGGTIQDPWDEIAGKYQIGTEVSGKIITVTNEGAFAEFGYGLVGLIPVSHEVVDDIKAKVIKVDIDNKKIALSIKDYEKNINLFQLEIIPLKKSDDEDKALFIVDEAQLVSDDYYQENDLRFGSGKLLHDFIKYIDFTGTNRKLIFIGDNFQLTMGKKDETPLNPEYLAEKYGLKARAFQLIDKGKKSLVVEQALIPVNGIRNETFNQLSFDLSENFKTIDTKELLPVLKSKLESNSDFSCLNFSNKDTKDTNEWIKRTIIENGWDIAPGDLIIFNNNLNIEDKNDPFKETKKIFNGQFGTVKKVGNPISEISEVPEISEGKKLKKKISIIFREVCIALKDTGEEVDVFSLENYRLSEKGELSKDEFIGLRLLMENEIKERLSQNPLKESEDFSIIKQSKEFESEGGLNSEFIKKLLKDGRTKTETENQKHLKKETNPARKQHRKTIESRLRKDTSSKYYRYKNSAHLRFGWALTVHKAMSYKWGEIFFDVGYEGRGKTNREYFKWIYTGLTRGKVKVNLINYKPINPLYKATIKDVNTGKTPDKNIYLFADNEAKISDLNDTTTYKYNFPEDNPIPIQLFQFLNPKLEANNISINSIKHPNYQEQYELKGTNEEKALISFYYNKKGEIKFPALMESNPKEFGDNVIKILKTENAIKETDIGIKDFSFIKDQWREDCYKQINDQLREIGGQFISIIQVRYKDTIKISKDDSELFVEIYYNADNFFSIIQATYYSDVELWKALESILLNIKG